MVAVQTAFWVTLVMAIIERTTGSTVGPERLDAPIRLPELPDDGRISVVDSWP